MLPAIQFKRVSKCYRMGRGLANLRSLVGNQNGAKANQVHWALKDVSFELQPGEALGIMALMELADHHPQALVPCDLPTSGEIRVNGRFSHSSS